MVVPSVPGFGFSDRPTRRGMTRSRVAALWAAADGVSATSASVPTATTWCRDHGLDGVRCPGPPDRHPHDDAGLPVAVIGLDVQPFTEAKRASPSFRLAGSRKRAAITCPGDPATDPGLRAPRLAGGAGCLDPGEVAGLDRSRGGRGAALLARSPPHQRHPLLGDRDRQCREPLLLRARPDPRRITSRIRVHRSGARRSRPAWPRELASAATPTSDAGPNFPVAGTSSRREPAVLAATRCSSAHSVRRRASALTAITPRRMRWLPKTTVDERRWVDLSPIEAIVSSAWGVMGSIKIGQTLNATGQTSGRRALVGRT